MKTIKTYGKICLGKVYGENIYLSSPSWDCNWYWGFGYLGNETCHYHIEGLKKIKTYNFDKKVFEYEFVNLYDGLKRHFGDTFIVKNDSDIWKLAELFETFYTLEKTAEVLDSGSSNLTTNPVAGIIINKEEVERINKVVIPVIFESIYNILEKYKY